jgi:hypothetical protein
VKPRPSYRAIDREEVAPGNPIDVTVHRRIGGARLQRDLARAAQSVVDALGRRRKAWFADEVLLSRIMDRRQAAYFDLGVEHGIAAARATVLAGGRESVNALAQHIVKEILRTGARREDAVGALIVAAWAIMNGNV